MQQRAAKLRNASNQGKKCTRHASRHGNSKRKESFQTIPDHSEALVDSLWHLGADYQISVWVQCNPL